MSRQLASIQTITDIIPIPNADKISQYEINHGWKVIDQKGKYQIKDNVIYIEIDSFVPHSLAPFLSKGKEPREYNGIKGERLKTIKLRGALSQGLILPLDILDEWDSGEETMLHANLLFQQPGEDVTDLLGIVKYEPPIPAQLQGKIRGSFPSFIKKTDQSRCISGDSIVETRLGPKEIKDVVIGDEVLSFNHHTNEAEYRKVLDTSRTSRQKVGWFKITTKTGKSLVVTHNHRIWVEDLGVYRKVSDLIETDTLKVCP